MLHSSSASSLSSIQGGVWEERWSECFGSGERTRSLSAPDQSQELVSCLGVLTENTQHGAGHSLAVHLLDASHNHTHVTGTAERTNTSWGLDILITLQKERKKEKKKEREKERKKERKRERKKERKRERKKERKRERKKERKKERKRDCSYLLHYKINWKIVKNIDIWSFLALHCI